MFDLDTWQEILDTVGKNKLRTVLTGFSVAWGIFMLVVLLGSGQGLAHGVEYGSATTPPTASGCAAARPAMPYRGCSPGRNVQFTNEDYDEVTDARAGRRAHHRRASSSAAT